MKKIILAVALAFSSLIAVPAASYADSITIRTDDGPGLHRGWERGEHRGWYNDNRRLKARMVHEDVRRHCVTKRVTTYRYGERVTRTTNVCR
ncbi:hypothetical protein FHX08_004763 [Rhizobium sp. BK529]|uniref:hypothetical protein n=1 Tax=Rhizobium sp. BK529 TaxID=2586983 RepID=UPI00160DF060|nr:hypothetical protein [Rhizobium sp. BK529]MBB3594359.1 hypothetical protein [Rhizobium sp. BK529]